MSPGPVVPKNAATSASAAALRSVVPARPGAIAVVIRPRQGSTGWSAAPVYGSARPFPPSCSISTKG